MIEAERADWVYENSGCLLSRATLVSSAAMPNTIGDFPSADFFMTNRLDKGL